MNSSTRTGTNPAATGDNNMDTAELIRAAENDDPKAQVKLAHLYILGSGVPKNRSVAVEWARKAADQGDADGQIYLGQLYENGWGVPQDKNEAETWYLKAAKYIHNTS